jgi:putative endonuclease
MTVDRVALGKTGEDLACAELRRRGYEIVARRYRVRGGEIDIVARDGATLVFVEVKAREAGGYGDAAEAVTPLKQRRLVWLARHYLMTARLHDCPCRFDVVAVRVDGGGAAAIEVYPNAFDAFA